MNTPRTDDNSLGHFIRHQLNGSLQALDPAVTDRLFAARQAALGHHAVLASPLSLAGAGQLTWNWCTDHLRPMMLACTLLLALTCGNYLMSSQRMNDLEEIDSALLADDLPINAYLDPGFHSWLADQSSRR